MTDYTPTTEEVRSYFRGSSFSRGEQFDRWLAEVKAQAWEEGSDAYILKITGHSTNGGFLRLDNPYRQGEGSGNSNSQPTAETPIYLNKQGED